MNVPGGHMGVSGSFELAANFLEDADPWDLFQTDGEIPQGGETSP